MTQNVKIGVEAEFRNANTDLRSYRHIEFSNLGDLSFEPAGEMLELSLKPTSIDKVCDLILGGLERVKRRNPDKDIQVYNFHFHIDSKSFMPVARYVAEEGVYLAFLTSRWSDDKVLSTRQHWYPAFCVLPKIPYGNKTVEIRIMDGTEERDLIDLYARIAFGIVGYYQKMIDEQRLPLEAFHIATHCTPQISKINRAISGEQEITKDEIMSFGQKVKEGLTYYGVDDEKIGYKILRRFRQQQQKLRELCSTY